MFRLTLMNDTAAYLLGMVVRTTKIPGTETRNFSFVVVFMDLRRIRAQYLGKNNLESGT